VLEVGLGGRLDAVNSVDADAALVVSVGIDHTDWLGADRDSIGYEKAGIYRPGRPALCADPDPPPRLLDHARNLGATFPAGRPRLRFRPHRPDVALVGGRLAARRAAATGLAGEHQLGNAAAALATLASLRDRCPSTPTPSGPAFWRCELPGRFQVISGPG
jgi:dihydrofolate synthase/folylpolyglutamate synthase